MLQFLNMAQTPGGFLLVLGLILGLLMWVFSQLTTIKKNMAWMNKGSTERLEELRIQLTNHIPHQIAALKEDQVEIRAQLEPLLLIPEQIAELKGCIADLRNTLE